MLKIRFFEFDIFFRSNTPETEEATRGEDREVFERRYHISAEEQSNGRGDTSSNNNQVCAGI